MTDYFVHNNTKSGACKLLSLSILVRKKVVGTDVQSHTREVVDKPPAAPQSVSDSAVQTVLDKNKPILVSV